MNPNQKTVYRVYAGGLSPTEKTVLGGMIRLAGRTGTQFQLEPELENADIVILDGTNTRSGEFGQPDSDARTAIWIDPPANLQAPRQINRPLNWSHLLEMIGHIADGNPKASAAGRSDPTIRMALDELCRVSESMLRMHIGIAAQFVVEDARAEIEARGAATEPVDAHVFLDILKRELPTNADAGKIIREMSLAMAQGRHA